MTWPDATHPLVGMEVRAAPAGGLDAPRLPERLGLAQRLERIQEECSALSADHRMTYPAEPVCERIHELAGDLQQFFRTWTLEICFLLDHHEALRFMELQQRLPGMSTKTLAARLRRLQERGLLQRIAFDESPPHVEYRLTEGGRHLVQMAFVLLLQIRQVGP
jgi:DNA-binding HxlR family transcriptional regulator